MPSLSKLYAGIHVTYTRVIGTLRFFLLFLVFSLMLYKSILIGEEFAQSNYGTVEKKQSATVSSIKILCKDHNDLNKTFQYSVALDVDKLVVVVITGSIHHTDRVIPR